MVSNALTDALVSAVGADAVSADEPTRRLMSEDIWSRGALAGLVVAPADAEGCARALAVCAAHGARVYPRGGGMSYTSGYTASEPDGVVFDLRRLDAIRVDAENRVVHVGAGATWAALLAALKPHGLRTPFWGPLSGISSTIGGGLSQNNAFFGASRYGPVSDSVIGVRVALPSGAVLTTGAGAQTAAGAFFRADGPDLTGLFLGDNGALGLKVEATLRLIPAPEHEGWASFVFPAREACAEAMAAMTAANRASEIFAFDPKLAALRMKRASLMADAASLAKVVTAGKSLLEGVKEGARMALAGRGFLDEGAYSVHVVCEGGSRAGVDADITALRRIAEAAGAKEVENTIPKVVRANPFTPLNNVLGPGGERYAPVHGIVRLSDAAAAWSAVDAALESFAPRFEAAGVFTGALATTLSTTAFLIEPVFYWPEERYALHEATMEAGFLKTLPQHAPNPAASALVAEARAAVIAVFTGFGATHFQNGRAYPFAQTRTPQALALLRTLKAALDPQGVLNPGVLGL
jgi:FAD/FMN-containing dehydrogenase